MTEKYQTADGQIHVIPAGATPDAVKRWADKNKAVPVQNATDDMSWGEKWGRLAETGERQAAAGLAALPNTFNRLSANNPYHVDDFQGEKYVNQTDMQKRFGGGEMTPEYAAYQEAQRQKNMNQPITKWVDENTPDAQDARKWISDLFGGATETLANTPIQRIVQKAAPAVTIGALTGGAGGVATAVEGGAAGLTSAVAGQSAREFGAPESVALPLELLGGLGPSAVRGGVGLVQKGAKMVDPGAEALFRKMNAGLKPEDIDTALSHVSQSAAEGTPVLYDEAIQDVTHGAAPQVSNLRRVVEADPAGGGQKISNMMGQRAGQNTEKIKKLIGDVETAPLPDGTPVPKMTEADLEDLGSATAREAKAATDSAARQRTEATKDLYAKVDFAHPGKLPGDLHDAPAAQNFANFSGDWKSIMRRPAVRAAWEKAKISSANRDLPGDSAFAIDKEGNVTMIRQPTGRELDTMKKKLDDAIEDSYNEKTKRPTSDTTDLIDAKEAFIDLADRAVPGYAEAREASGKAAEAIKPVTEGSMATVRDVKGSPAEMRQIQREELFPKAPDAAQPELAADKLRLLRGDPQTSRYQPGGGQRVLNPTGQRQLASHLESELNKATTGTASVPDSQQAGSSWWAKTMGNPAQRENLLSQVKAMAGDEAHKRLESLGKWLKMQGRRPPVGSPTNTNREITEALKQSGAGVVAEGVTAAASGGRSLIGRGVKAIEQRLEERAMRLNSKELAEMLTDPSTAAKWRQIQKLPETSAQRTRLILSLFPKVAPTAADAATPDNRLKAK